MEKNLKKVPNCDCLNSQFKFPRSVYVLKGIKVDIPFKYSPKSTTVRRNASLEINYCPQCGRPYKDA